MARWQKARGCGPEEVARESQTDEMGLEVMELLNEWWVLIGERKEDQMKWGWPHLNPHGGFSTRWFKSESLSCLCATYTLPSFFLHNTAKEKYPIINKPKPNTNIFLMPSMVHGHTKLKPSCSLYSRHLASMHTTKQLPFFTLLVNFWVKYLYFFWTILILVDPSN